MTSSPSEGPAALTGLRVLELGGALTNYCGKLFAELGADVILVEPPQGGDLRSEPPFVDDDPTAASLSFFYQNSSKRGIVVDLDDPDGQEVVHRLVATADIVLEDKTPGYLAERGLGPDDLLSGKPGLVVTSITPFGQTGPCAAFLHSDLVCMAWGGMLWMGGYEDGPPVRAVGDQAYMAGNLFGAVASLVAVTHAELAGVGQHVDVSVQEAVAMGLENAAQYYDLEQRIRRRFGGTQREAGFGLFPCADGQVFLLAAGIGGNRFWPNMVEWIVQEGRNGEKLVGGGWGESDYMQTQEAKDTFWRVFTDFAADKTRAELYHASQKWRVPLGPVNFPSDVVASAQLEDRAYFVEMEVFGRSFQAPGAPYQLSATPWRMTAPAPRLGEHTDSVLSDAGYSNEDIRHLRSRGAVA